MSITPNLGAIPATLKEWNQWVVWRVVERGGKSTKMPVCARTRQAASTTNPETWGTFGEASAALANDPGLAGIGFVFSDSDPFVGIDFDNVIQEGTIQPWALDALVWLDSYAEISPSGGGVKVWIEAPEFQGWKGSNRQDCGRPGAYGQPAGLEMYCQGRFFAVTGSRYDRFSDIFEREDQARKLKQAFFASTTSTPTPTVSSSIGRSADFDVRDAQERAALWAQHRDPAIEGAGGDAWTNETISFVIHGFQLTPEEACDSLIHWNQSCIPEWDWGQFVKKAQRCSAWSNGWLTLDGRGNALGYKNREVYGDAVEWTPVDEKALAAMLTAPPEPEPESPPEAPPTLDMFEIPPPGELVELTEDDYAPTPLIDQLVTWGADLGIRPIRAFGLCGAVSSIAWMISRRVLTPIKGDQIKMLAIAFGQTGAGKDIMKSIIRRLSHAIGSQDPTINDVTAVSMVHKRMVEKGPNVVHVIDEFGEKVANELYSKRDKPANFNWKSFFLSMYTDRHISVEKSTGSIDIYYPGYHLLGMTVPDKLFRAGGDEAMIDGFLNRFLVFADDKTVGLPLPPCNLDEIDDEVPPDVREWFCKWARVREANTKREVRIRGLGEDDAIMEDELNDHPRIVAKMRPELRTLMARYKDFCDDRGEHTSIYSRSMQNAVRLATICAVSEILPRFREDGSVEGVPFPHLELRHLKWGVKIAEYSTALSLHFMKKYRGKTPEAQAASWLLSMLKDRGCDGMSKSEITKKIRNKHNLLRQKDEVIKNLIDSNEITSRTVRTGSAGRPAQWYWLTEFAPEEPEQTADGGSVVESVSFDV